MTENKDKDVNLLKRVSIYFTEDVLKSVVAAEKCCNSNNVEILSWNFGDASEKGDSYMSVVDRVSIQSKINGKIVETRIIVKSLPQNIGRRVTFRSVEFFDTEIIFYTQIASRFEKFLKSKGQSQLMNIPRCLAYHHDKENDFLVLQDVGVLGYGPLCRQSSLNYQQCKDVAETLGRFHAISFGYKNEQEEDYDKMAGLLTETFYREDIYENWYKRFHNTVLLRIAKDALAKEYPGSRGQQVFNSYEPGALVKKAIEICSRTKARTSVIGQGDAWAPNFLARETNPGKFDVLMLDFQLARNASPVLDISFFIYACTDQPMRDKYYDNIIKDYYNELAKSMQLLNVDPKIVYPWELFQKELKEQSVYGLTFALEAVPFTMMPAEEAFDLDQIKENKVDISDVFTLSNIQSSENRRRHAEMILHAVENGFI